MVILADQYLQNIPAEETHRLKPAHLMFHQTVFTTSSIVLIHAFSLFFHQKLKSKFISFMLSFGRFTHKENKKNDLYFLLRPVGCLGLAKQPEATLFLSLSKLSVEIAQQL